MRWTSITPCLLVFFFIFTILAKASNNVTTTANTNNNITISSVEESTDSTELESEVEPEGDAEEDDEVEFDLHANHVTLGILVDLHEGTSETQDEEMRNDSVPGVLCGSLNLHAFQQLAAVRWTTEFLNEKSFPNEYGLDVVVHDTCGESGIALSETHQLLEWAKENTETPLVGVIVIGSRNNERVIDKPMEILNRANISAIVTSSRAAELLLSTHHNVFTTAPDISSVTEAIVALIRELEANSVAVLSSCSHAMKKFEKVASQRSVRVKHFSVIAKDNLLISDTVLNFLKGEANSSKTVVLLLEPSELDRLLGATKHLEELQKLADQKTWIIGSVGMTEQLVHDWSTKIKSKLFVVQPHVSPNVDFNTYFLENLKGALAAEPSEETQEYIERTYDCEWPISSEESITTSCSNLTSVHLSQKFSPDPDISFIVSSVSAYSAALRLAQLKNCKEAGVECETSSTQQLSADVVEALATFNFPKKVTEVSSSTEGPEIDSTNPTIATEHELEGTRGRINHQGKLISRRYNVFFSEGTQRISRVGQYSLEHGLVVDPSFTMPVEIQTTNSPRQEQESDESEEPVERATGIVPATRTRSGKNALSDDVHYENSKQRYNSIEDHVNTQQLTTPEFYISRVWALVVLAIGITGVFLALYMLVYVLLKMCDGTLHGNQTMGILLLLCVMILYSSVVLFVLPPGPLLCNLRVFLPSIALAFSFGILLLKAMQLRSLVSLGLGGRVSTFNQFVTLAFIVAVQLAINLQWLLSPNEPEDALEDDSLHNDCSQPHLTYLLLHSYIGLLIVFVFLYGISVLKIRRNFNEARWVTLTSLFSLPVIIGWVVVVLFGPPEYQEPASCVSFMAFATVILFIIFIPKLGTISEQSHLSRRKRMLQQVGPGYTGSISTIFTTLGSERGLGTLQSQKRGHNTYYSSTSSPPPPPPMSAPQPPIHSHHHIRSHHQHSHHSNSPSNNNAKCVTYSPRLATNVFHSPSTASSMARSTSNMKTPFFSSNGGAYP